MALPENEMLARLRDPSYPASALSEAFRESFPVAGASVATVGDLLGNETLSASDALASRIDELQFDLGEGPCWDAVASGEIVDESDLAAGQQPRWPLFTRAALDHDVAAIIAFPLYVGPLRIGAIDMYAHAPSTLTQHERRRASAMADSVSRRVLDAALQSLASDQEPSTPFSRRIVHQATGIVFAQLGLPMDDARLVIQGHAFATNRSMMEIAEELIEGRLRFGHERQDIEDER